MKIIIDVADELLEQLKPAIENGESICTWAFTSEFDYELEKSDFYRTDCGHGYYDYLVDWSGDDAFRFCPFCGKNISLAR